MTETTAGSLVLTEEIKGLVNGALANGTPLLLAAVSPEGKPVVSFRGSLQTYSDDQLGVWARHSQGGTLEAIAANPNVVLVYRSATTWAPSATGITTTRGCRRTRLRRALAAARR